MDIWEFDLLYNKTSPLFDDSALRTLIYDNLVKESLITPRTSDQTYGKPPQVSALPGVQRKTQKRQNTTALEQCHNTSLKGKHSLNRKRKETHVKDKHTPPIVGLPLQRLVETSGHNRGKYDSHVITLAHHNAPFEGKFEASSYKKENIDSHIKNVFIDLQTDIVSDGDNASDGDILGDGDIVSDRYTCRDIFENVNESVMLRRNGRNTDLTSTINDDNSIANTLPPTSAGIYSQNTINPVTSSHVAPSGIKQNLVEHGNTNSQLELHLTTPTSNSHALNTSFGQSIYVPHNKFFDNGSINCRPKADTGSNNTLANKETLGYVSVHSHPILYPKNDALDVDETYEIGDPWLCKDQEYLSPHANPYLQECDRTSSYSAQPKIGAVSNVPSTTGAALIDQSPTGASLNVQSQPGAALNVHSQTGNVLKVQSQTGAALNVHSQTGDVLNVQSQTGAALNVHSQTGDVLNVQSQTGAALNVQSQPSICELSVHCCPKDEPTIRITYNKDTDPYNISVDEINSIIDKVVKANAVFTEFHKHGAEKKVLPMQKQNQRVEASDRISDDDPLASEKRKAETRRRVLVATVEYLEMKIKESVRFAKQIPGFVDLHTEDQVGLIKASRTESAMVGGMRGINQRKSTFSSVNGSTFTLEDMKLVYSEGVLRQQMVLSKAIAALSMSSAEEALVRAISITMPDRCRLLNYSNVEAIQLKLLSCLVHVISNNGENAVGPRLGKIIDLLANLRHASEVDVKELKHILLEWSSFSKYELVAEYL